MRALIAIALAAGLAGAAIPAHAGPARDRIEERLRAARDQAVARQLDLDPAAMARLAAVLARHDDAIDRHRVEAVRLRRGVDAAITSGDDRAIDAAVEALLVHRRGLTGLEEARLRAARTVLTPAQAARLAIVLPRIERRMENRIRRVLERRRGRAERWRDRPATGTDR